MPPILHRRAVLAKTRAVAEGPGPGRRSAPRPVGTVTAVAPRRIAVRLLPLFAALLLGACGSDEQASSGGSSAEGSTSAASTADSGERIEIPGAGEALTWGEGKSTVLLAHGAAFDAASWEEQAAEIAAAGHLVVALEETTPESILAASSFLRDDRSAKSVALVGASAGADASLQALSMMPDAFDQLITLSVNSTAEGLGSEPKLFIASEDEPLANLSTELADGAEGSDNEALLLSGSAHAQAIFDGDQSDRALSAILDRLAAA